MTAAQRERRSAALAAADELRSKQPVHTVVEELLAEVRDEEL